ncbi:sulfite exporter TauE/SafE family protein [Paraburkholderia phymatum]|uniref:Probable membrane transporter protein n=1 Tax=Paraburkholderia phymatum (strain DSM 17167 / CIP 108236 / LMG 21445 / STM815) TaxID=391038 RepID=B2JWC5_PARP8|nr:sulfite exporter TauE/SafE family protein [Paraburkholderia phymatum]ACC75252.1 protein of unknown function DUF81 [Paraburkholderia phymatum STM815]
MTLDRLIPLLALMGAASYFQTVTGFGLGMIVIGVASATNLAPVTSVAALVSVVTLGNCAIALPGKLHHVDWRAVGAATLGIVPSVIAGVALLNYLSAAASTVLHLLLGIVVLYGGLGSALRPAPLERRSGNRGFFTSGVFGGLLSGMFSISGPPLIYQFYRQPLSVTQIRCALIVLFGETAAIRTAFSASTGQLNATIWLQAAIALPIVCLSTLAARHRPPPLSGVATRRIAFGVLVIIGGQLVLSSVWRLVA